MSPLSLLIVIAAAVAHGESLEHVTLSSAPRDVIVDSLGGRIAFVGLSDRAIIAAAKKSTLCPKTARRAEGGRLELVCTSRRLVVDVSGRTLRLRVRSVAPITTDTSRPPAIFYDPVVNDLGGPCPGTTSSSRAECALQQGKLVQAALDLRAAFAAVDGAHAYAALRLGDLAWLADDLESAANWYDKAGAGPFARVAASRLCELTPGCVQGPSARLQFNAWDTGALPAVFADEITLRRARALAFADGLDDAVRVLAKRSSSCARAMALCREIATEALRARRGRDAPEALAFAIALPSAFEGEGALELARVVVEHTQRLAAPVYSASVLAAVSAVVPTPELSAHLAQTATLYLDADDDVRADIVIGFAKSRGFTSTVRWQKIGARYRALKAGTIAPMSQATRADAPKAAKAAKAAKLPKSLTSAKAAKVATVEQGSRP